MIIATQPIPARKSALILQINFKFTYNNLLNKNPYIFTVGKKVLNKRRGLYLFLDGKCDKHRNWYG